MIASSAGSVELLDATGLDERHQPERLDGGSEGHDPVDVADGAQQASGRIDLDDVAAVHALLDAVAYLRTRIRGTIRFSRRLCEGELP